MSGSYVSMGNEWATPGVNPIPTRIKQNNIRTIFHNSIVCFTER